MIATWEDHTTKLSEANKKTAAEVLHQLTQEPGAWLSLDLLTGLAWSPNSRTTKKCIQYLRDQGHFILSSQKGYCYYDREKNGPIEAGSDAWRFLEALREMAWRHGASYMRMKRRAFGGINQDTFPDIKLPETDKP